VFVPSPKEAKRRRDFEEEKLVPPRENAQGEKLERDPAQPVVDLHSLRSSLAVRLAKQIVPSMIAQRLLRHASVTTTTRHYVKL
jgi:integrase